LSARSLNALAIVSHSFASKRQQARPTFMLADEYPKLGALCPQTIAGSPVSSYLNKPEVDAVVANSVADGSKFASVS
jgi:hypothetical protein